MIWPGLSVNKSFSFAATTFPRSARYNLMIFVPRTLPVIIKKRKWIIKKDLQILSCKFLEQTKSQQMSSLYARQITLHLSSVTFCCDVIFCRKNLSFLMKTNLRLLKVWLREIRAILTNFSPLIFMKFFFSLNILAIFKGKVENFFWNYMECKYLT